MLHPLVYSNIASVYLKLKQYIHFIILSAFWKVEFPVAKSGVASAGIFAFLTSWNEYALASQLTRSTFSKTMPVGLRDFTSEFTINWGGMCALAVLMIIPALILTFLVQKHLIAGLTFGGVKG